MKNLLRFITILFVTITLGTLLAHLFALPRKINLSKENYQLVQQLYRGWSWIGFAEIGAILLTIGWVYNDQKRKRTFPYLLTAALCFIISLAVFFLFTFPANRATHNWLQLPANWETLKKQWEYSHAARAVINLAGFSLLIIVLLKERNNRNWNYR